MAKIGRPAKTNRSPLGERLQALREEANITQRDMANELGISQPSYNKWERRNIALTQDQLQKLASILGVDIKDFFTTTNHIKANGPIGRTRKTFEKIASLPSNRQKKILDVIDMLLSKE